MIKADIRKTSYVKGKVIPLNYNYMFVGIFNNENNIDIVEAFLSLYLKRPLSEIKNHVKIKSRNLSINNKNEKDKQVDLLLDLNKEKINIELSTSGSQRVIERDIVYSATG